MLQFFYYQTSIYVGHGKTMIKELVRLHFQHCIGVAFPSPERAQMRTVQVKPSLALQRLTATIQCTALQCIKRINF